MSFLRITEPNVSAVSIDDLGIEIAQAAVVVLSDQFSVADLYLSADLEALVIAGTLTIELDFGTGYTSVAAVDYTNRDTLGTFLNVYEITNEDNNEDLVDGSEVNSSGPASAPLHIHDARYYTETELVDSGAGTPGAGLIGADDTACVGDGTGAFTTVQGAIDALCAFITSGAMDDLDTVYSNDSDGRMDVDEVTKPLDFRSNDTNDIIISRTDTVDIQDILRADVSADELLLGSLVQGGLAQTNVRVLSDLYVDGNITFVGTITDTTVTNMNVTNSEILLRDGAGAGGDAAVLVERGATGADACVSWNETTDRWESGIVGTKATIPGIENNEAIEGVWCFGGVDDTEPDMCLLEKSDSAPPTVVGAAGEVPMAMMENGLLAIYDKSNSRNKWLSVQREFMLFSGRDNNNNTNEYARAGDFTSNQAGNRLIKKATLIGISIQTNGAESWTAEVRKNGTVTVQSSLAAVAVAGNQTGALNVDFDAGDEIQVYINGSMINRPVIKLEFAYRFAA